MVYKILMLEAIAVCGMLYLRFEPRVEFGNAETTAVTGPPATSATGSPQAVADKEITPAPAAVAPLPWKRVTVVDEALLFPVAGYGPEHVISVFGDKRGKTRLHQGIDIKAPRGTHVVATTDGFIERVRDGGSGGKCVYLRDGTGRLFYYAHLDEIGVAEYAAVKAGAVLGTVGDTGNARGTTPHLHFEVLLGKERKAVDPMGFWTGV